MGEYELKEEVFKRLANERAKERERKKALENWDAIPYRTLCDELGVTPEAPELYELGEISNDSKEQFNQLEKTCINEGKIPGKDFYVPGRSYELKKLIKDYCEENGKELPKNFDKMKKKQLYAIYFAISGAKRKK